MEKTRAKLVLAAAQKNARSISAIAVFGGIILSLVGYILPALIESRSQRSAVAQFPVSAGVWVRYEGPHWLLRFASDDCRDRYVEASAATPWVSAKVRQCIGNHCIDRLIAVFDVVDKVSFSSAVDCDARWKSVATLLPSLQSARAIGISLSCQRMTTADLSVLSKMTNLRTVVLLDGAATDEALRDLEKCNSLRYLNISGGSVSDKGVPFLQNLKKLEALEMRQNKISDRSIMILKNMGSLVSLDLTGSDVSDSGVAELREALPKAKITNSDEDVSVEGVYYTDIDTPRGFERRTGQGI